ncbi:MAG: alpha/beta fold hydrolase [Acidimicrobiia bacterium]|nr:alpha/beta fold hydrolase [Acidimicrobiia bacterium]
MNSAVRPYARLVGTALAAALLATTLGACSSTSNANPYDPAFYATPSTIPAGIPGQVVRFETMAAPFPDSQAWRVLYTSTSYDGSPIVVSGMVFAPTDDGPAGEAPAGGRPVVSWAHPTTGIVDACAPSRIDDPYGDVQGLQEFLAKGWVVTATDYQGLGTDGMHPYLVGSSEARGTIDIVRAARAIVSGVKVSNRYAVFGHSQGGQAVLFAGQMAKSYAPDLNLVAVAAAAPAGLLTELFNADKDTAAGAVLGSYAVESWSTLFGYDVGTVVHSNFERRVEAVSNKCVVGGSKLSDIELGIDDLILRGRMWSSDPATTPPWSGQFDVNTAAKVPIPVPVLVTQGTDDKIVRPWSTVQLVQDYTDNGTTITETQMAGVDHMKAGHASVPYVVPFFATQFS